MRWSAIRSASAGSEASTGSVIAPLNDLHVELHNLGAECGIYIAMHPDEAVQQLAETLQREGIELGQRQLQSRRVYDALGAIDPASLDAVERRFVDISRTDMRRAGALLGPAERDRARALRAELTRLGQDHARNIRDDTRYIALEGTHELDGLPADYIATHQPGADGTIRISTNPPDHQPFMTYAHSDRARKALQTVYLDRAPENVEVLAALTRTRHELARILGYPNWARYNVEDRRSESLSTSASRSGWSSCRGRRSRTWTATGSCRSWPGATTRSAGTAYANARGSGASNATSAIAHGSVTRPASTTASRQLLSILAR